MPEEDLKALLSKVASDPVLQQKLEAQRVDTHWFVVLAKEAGFSITVDFFGKHHKPMSVNTLCFKLLLKHRI